MRKAHLGFVLSFVTPDKEYPLFSDNQSTIPTDLKITASPHTYFKIELIGTISGSKADIALQLSPYSIDEQIDISFGIGEANELIIMFSTGFAIAVASNLTRTAEIFTDINGLICWELKEEPDLGLLPCLSELHLCYSAFKRIGFIHSYPTINSLSIIHCILLNDISEIAGHESISNLTLHGCKNLHDIDALGNLVNLVALKIIECSSVKDLSIIGYLERLETLVINGNVYNHNFLANLSKLKNLTISFDNTIENLHPLANLHNIVELKIVCCSKLVDIQGVTKLAGLRKLTISWCPELVNVNQVSSLTELVFLDLSLSTSLADISAVGHLTKLTSLDLSFCKPIVNFLPIFNLTELRNLNLCGLPELINIDFISDLYKLEKLNLSWCTGLDNVNGLVNLKEVHTIDLSFCSALTNIDGLFGLNNLRYLNLCFCQTLEDIDALIQLSNLETLLLSGCENLESLIGLANLTKLKELDLSYCEGLEYLLGREYLSNLSGDVLKSLFKFAATWGKYEPNEVYEYRPCVDSTSISTTESLEAISSDIFADDLETDIDDQNYLTTAEDKLPDAEKQYLELAREIYAAGELTKNDKLLLIRKADELGLSREVRSSLILQAKTDMEGL